MFILELESISKSFGGLSAVKNLSFTLTAGKILALIGPNGSGKTTAFNLISGFLKPDTGTIRFNGRNIAGVRAYNVCQAGITRTFQSIRPFMNMTALENVMVGRLYGNEPARSMKEARIESEEILVLIGLDKKRLTRAGMLGLVDRKRLEIARALATRPRLLLLDEMMAGLNPRELEDAMRLIKGIRDSGVTLIVVEHVMKAVWGISDSVIVLNAGQKIAEGTPGEIMNNTQVIEAYLGEEQGA
jgi:branched-chain amino acid transport system ATP-binding protein